MTPAALDLQVMARRAAGKKLDDGIPLGVPGADAPLSSGQERMWLVEQMSQQSGISNYIFMVWLRGELDVSALERAVGEMHRRHQILRTVFVICDGVPKQRVRSAADLTLPTWDLRMHPNPRERARQFANEVGTRPYRLTEKPAVRWQLLRVDEREHALVLCIHHVVADGWSEALIRRELSALYTAFHEERPSPLPELPLQYADYAAWQRRRHRDGEFDAQLNLLEERLADAPVALTLPGGLRAQGHDGMAGATIAADVPADIVNIATDLAVRENASLFMVLLAAFSIVLARSGGETDVVIGAPVAGRSRPELEPLIGFFVNTIALRVDLSGDPTFQELLGRVRDVSLDSYANQDVPFERLIEALRPAREPGRQPLVQVLFQLINTPDAVLELPGLDTSWEQLFAPASPMDLSVNFQPTPGGLTGFWSYRTSVLGAGTVRRMQAHFETVLRALAAEPLTRVGDNALMGVEESHRLTEWGRGLQSHGETSSTSSSKPKHARHLTRWPW